MNIKVVIDLAKSPHVDLDVDESAKFIECLKERAWITRDLEEAERIIRNFDEFYRYMKKKFEDYITPPKNPADSILGKVVIHKLRLYTEDNHRKVEIIFDRRFPLEKIKECLNELGYTDIQVEKQMF